MEASIHIFAPTVKGVMLNTLRTVTVSTDRVLKGLLERTTLLRSLKRFWRDQLTRVSAKQVTSR
jgi:hypothetical protein